MQAQVRTRRARKKLLEAETTATDPEMDDAGVDAEVPLTPRREKTSPDDRVPRCLSSSSRSSDDLVALARNDEGSLRRTTSLTGGARGL